MYVRKLREPLVGPCRQQSMVQYQLIPILFLPSWQAVSKMNPQLMTLCTIVPEAHARKKEAQKNIRVTGCRFFFTARATINRHF